jgi:hypothetical protein
MLGNYLTIAFRNLQREKLYAFINVVGLTIGVAFSILAFFFVRQEWTFDAFHVNADRIFRVYSSSPENTGDSTPKCWGSLELQEFYYLLDAKDQHRQGSPKIAFAESQQELAGNGYKNILQIAAAPAGTSGSFNLIQGVSSSSRLDSRGHRFARFVCRLSKLHNPVTRSTFRPYT